jgi:hypothetical protein
LDFPRSRKPFWNVVNYPRESRHYEKIGDLSALLKARALGHPENAASLGLEAVYDDGVNEESRKEIGMVW